MNLLSKTFGATGKISVDVTSDGLVIDVSDSEKMSDQSIHEVIHPTVVIDGLVHLLGSPSWMVNLATMLKAELVAVSLPKET